MLWVSSLWTWRCVILTFDAWRCRTWILIFGMSGLIVLFWFVAGGVALRYLVSPHSEIHVLLFI